MKVARGHSINQSMKHITTLRMTNGALCLAFDQCRVVDFPATTRTLLERKVELDMWGGPLLDDNPVNDAFLNLIRIITSRLRCKRIAMAFDSAQTPVNGKSSAAPRCVN